jgi:hypothetical protein
MGSGGKFIGARLSRDVSKLADQHVAESRDFIFRISVTIN